MAAAQMIVGPLSDSVGRKLALAIFLFGSLLSMIAASFSVMHRHLVRPSAPCAGPRGRRLNKCPGLSFLAATAGCNTRAVQIQTSASVIVRGSRDGVFDYAVGHIPELFRGAGPIPAIESVEYLEGKPIEVGTIRRVHNADNSVIEEEIVAHQRPSEHGFRVVRGLKPPVSFLLKWIEGNWSFEPEGDEATRVIWDFRFELTSPLAWAPANLIAKVFFGKAIRGALDRLRQQFA